MSKTKRYNGEFLTRGDHVCRCEIWREGIHSGEVGELDFPGDEPLTIEWQGEELHAAIVPGSATLRVESPGDRTYIDLYTVNATEVELRVYIDDVLFWTGSLDTEQYEEPYAWGSGYDVELTFSDFGVLKRMPFAVGDGSAWGSGLTSVWSVVIQCLSAAALPVFTTEQGISTLNGSGVPLDLRTIGVRAENFRDEDGEWMMLWDVLEAVLQPLALRIEQRGGKFHLYDLNAMANLAPSSLNLIDWDSTDQVLSATEVYNHIRITFSPYLNATCRDEAPDIDTDSADWQQDIYTNASDSLREAPGDGLNQESRITHYTRERQGVQSRGGWLRRTGLFSTGKTDTICAYAVLFAWNTADQEWRATHFAGQEPTDTEGEPLFRLPDIRIDTHFMQTGWDYMLRLKVAMMVSALYNPFGGADEKNWTSDQDSLEDSFKSVCLRVGIRLAGDDGNVYHYENHAIAERGRGNTPSLDGDCGWWYEGEAHPGQAYLQWYDADDPYGGKAVNGTGFKANRHCIGFNGRKPLNNITKRDDGQYLPLPPVTGVLQVVVYPGLWSFIDWTGSGENTWGASSRWDVVRWWLFKDVTIDVVAITAEATTENEDIEFTGVANPSAREDLGLDTTCGTTDHPLSRGAYRRMSDGSCLTELTRQGRHQPAEQLLIGTLLSQYAERRVRLSGEARPRLNNHTSMPVWRDAAQPADTHFIITSESMRVREETSDAVFDEVRADYWKGTDE